MPPRLISSPLRPSRFNVLEQPNGGNLKTILVDQDVTCECDPLLHLARLDAHSRPGRPQDYMKERPSEPTKTVNSLLTLERGSDGLITRHTEEWDHKKETTSEDGQR